MIRSPRSVRPILLALPLLLAASTGRAEAADEAACGVNPRLARIDFPIRCQGSLDEAPGQWCGFDREAFQSSLAELAKDEAKRKAGERIDEELDKQLDDETRQKIDEKLGDGAAEKLGNKIRDIFQ